MPVFGLTFWSLNHGLFCAIAGISSGPPPVQDLTEELMSPSSIADLFEVVADDLQTLNKNLLSVSSIFVCIEKLCHNAQKERKTMLKTIDASVVT